LNPSNSLSKIKNIDADIIKKINNKYRRIYDLRPYKKKFIPLEKVAMDPRRYGFDIEPRPSKARQQDFIDDDNKIKAVIAANRSGKTEAGAIASLKIIDKSKINGRFWILSETKELQLAGTQEKIIDYLKPEKIIYEQHSRGDTITELRVRNKHGKVVKIEFKTYEQGVSKLQSAKLIGAWMDEEPPEKIYDEVYTRTVDLRGQIIMTFTPLKGFTWSYDRIFNSKAEYISVFNWGMADNPFIPEDEIDRMKKDWSPKKCNMRLFGRYQGAEQQMFYEFDRDLHFKRTGLYQDDQPVDVCVDWGVRCVSIQFWQECKIIDRYDKFYMKYTMINASELENVGYNQVMSFILSSGYILRDYFCDQAGRQRSQATRSGTSLLTEIQKDFGIRFRYITNLGIEESTELVNGYFVNGDGLIRIEIDSSIILNEKGDTPAKRLENYARDSETLEPIKDGINDHFCDTLRYYIANKTRAFAHWSQQ
jgi:phage terminase large subunit-like protein